MNNQLPLHIVLPLRDCINEFQTDMGVVEDQHYETDGLLNNLIEAAIGLNSQAAVNEVVEMYADFHDIAFKGRARQFLGTLGCCIMQTVNAFGFRAHDGRFPYIVIQEDDGLYFMEKIQI